MIELITKRRHTMTSHQFATFSSSGVTQYSSRCSPSRNTYNTMRVTNTQVAQNVLCDGPAILDEVKDGGSRTTR